MKLSKLIRVLHRDLGYLFFGMSILYAISGIALNHIRDFNTSFNIHRYTLDIPAPINPESVDNRWIEDLLIEVDEPQSVKKYYYPKKDEIKVFLKNGTMALNLNTGKGMLETLYKRPFLFQVNFLHYNPGRWWKWFSDIFCIAWIIISVTGLFIIKNGKHSIKRRGALWTIAGVIIPIIIFFLYS